jgi:UDP-MurNAc hydroxylase
MTKKNSIYFVNHASILLKGKSKGLLSDPWYWGDCFNKGWLLLYNNTDNEIITILKATNAIWISHEHPDHFSVPFYLKFGNLIKKLKIKIYFQYTNDKRLINFLIKNGFCVIEVNEGQEIVLEENFSFQIVKSEFYDSALIAKINNKVIFNLNDCPLHDQDKIKSFKSRFGPCDVLLTQFSYAAWKGGSKNIKWRNNAAKEKLNTMYLQSKILEAKILIPFASFIRFANAENIYLNDGINSPKKVLDFFASKHFPINCLFMKPLDFLSLDSLNMNSNLDAIRFWESKFNRISELTPIHFLNSNSFDDVKKNFKIYSERIRRNNSWILMFLLQKVRLGNFFKPVIIRLYDLDCNVNIDLVSEHINITTKIPDITMHSQSLIFIFQNPFGFDTLTINGCFNARSFSNFQKFTKTFAIENLNCMGHKLSLGLFFKLDLVFLFFSRLKRVRREM